MNHLEGLKRLKNRYFLIRHGESKANTAGIILSDPKDGTTGFGLTETGMMQVRESASKNKQLDKDTVIYSSDFIRAKETAEIVREVIGSKPIHHTRLLRERHFGRWERTSNSNYQKVWDDDAKDPNHKNHEVEAAAEVLDRTTRLVSELEKKYSGRKIALVAHGDALQILQTGFMKQCPSTHRGLKHIEVAEIREIKLH